MSVSIVSIGNELLSGRTLNTNLQFLAAALDARGIVVDRAATVPDDAAMITEAVQSGLRESRVVITIGGLGPTDDDLTRPAVAAFLDTPLEANTEVEQHIRALYTRRGRTPKSKIFRQAMVPAGATPFLNQWGSAPGLWCPVADSAVVMLPGPPSEFRPMVETCLLPKLAALLPADIHRRTLTVYGTPESVVESTTAEILGQTPGIARAFCASAGTVRVDLSAPPNGADAVDRAYDAVLAGFAADAAPGSRDLVEILVEAVRARGWRLATAESCTGGGIAARITDLAGVSDVFAGAVVAYSNALKQSLLGVSPETLARVGAVSEQVAAEMVRGLCSRCQVQAGIAVTGIAGPDGGTAVKPVGLVYIATQVDGEVRVSANHFNYDRAQVRRGTVATALDNLRRHITTPPPL